MMIYLQRVCNEKDGKKTPKDKFDKTRKNPLFGSRTSPRKLCFPASKRTETSWALPKLKGKLILWNKRNVGRRAVIKKKKGVMNYSNDSKILRKRNGAGVTARVKKELEVGKILETNIKVNGLLHTAN